MSVDKWTSMPPEAAVSLALAFVLSVALAVRWTMLRRERSRITRRLSHLLDPRLDATAAATSPSTHRQSLPAMSQFIENAQATIAQAGLRYALSDVVFTCGSLFLTSLSLALIFGFDWLIGAAVGITLAAVPWIVVTALAHKRRSKFIEQLPNALDLFVSVLRSGHAVPQAVRAVAEEIPAPCGQEFGEMMQRMNLGQTLPQALSHSVKRFRSFELDLIRRATEIQMDVGGSLAELLDKTNSTLRQRLKLQRQVQVLTAPSRLSAVVIFVLPFLIAGSFSLINPQYMSPLTETKLGRGLLCLAFAAQVIGYLIMRRLASFKV